MSSEYRIEKERLQVVVTTTAGERIPGELFVQAYTRYRMGREEPRDVLNDHEPFFPLATLEEGTFLLAKDNVREVEVAGEMDDDIATTIGARAQEIEIVLSGGIVRTGAIFLEVSSDRPRLLDFLNRVHDRFLTLHTPDGVRLVNRRLVERVRPID